MDNILCPWNYIIDVPVLIIRNSYIVQKYSNNKVNTHSEIISAQNGALPNRLNHCLIWNGNFFHVKGTEKKNEILIF